MIWQKLSKSERLFMISKVGEQMKMSPIAIEKDWWVIMVLKALSILPISNLLNFKGGTSLSKGFGLIERFSEDIDLSLRREGEFAISSTSKSQREKLRKRARFYIQSTLKENLEKAMKDIGLTDFNVLNVTQVATKDGWITIDGDKDPTVIVVEYKSIVAESNEYMPSRVKIEISCLSMHEPVIDVEMKSYITSLFPNEDKDAFVRFNTVLPNRTFLEKAFLLCEEFNKNNPRYYRMSRHLYDLEKIMDTDYGKIAIQNKQLYYDIINHRREFYALKYMDYDKLLPSSIDFCPPESVLNDWKSDYELMIRDFIYGEYLPFDKLLNRIKLLRERFRNLAFL